MISGTIEIKIARGISILSLTATLHGTESSEAKCSFYEAATNYTPSLLTQGNLAYGLSQ